MMAGETKKAAEILLEVKNLSVNFGAFSAVKNVSLDIRRGETMAIVGESGSGKSVTALSVLKLLPYPPAHHPSGEILFKGQDLLKADATQLRKVRGNDIAMIFQEPMTSLNPLHSIERQIGEILSVHRGLRANAARARTLELLHQVGIKEPEKRLGAFPHQLSGGQRQRVMIAMALANEPDLLIADEPTTALDVTVQAQILELLKKLQAETGMAILFITHDLGIVRRMAARVCVMKGGEIVEQGAVSEIFDAPKHDYTKMLLAAGEKGAPAEAPEKRETILQVDDLKVWFPIKAGLMRKTIDYIKAVNGISFALDKGKTLGIVGESGSGKTTLGLAVLRLLRSEGRIVFQGREISALPAREMRELRGDMQIVFQDPFGSLSPRMTVGAIIAEGLDVHFPDLSVETRDQKLINVLREVGLDPDTRHRYPHEFSGGQRQRISLARALVLEPDVLVLDEPTSALDVSVQSQIVDLLREVQERHDLTYLFISHDLAVVRALAHEVIIMRQGVAVEQGRAKEIFANPQTAYTKALIDAAFYREKG